MCSAFIAPADIQIFTSESKNKLNARYQSKKLKHFASAVDEICEAFEKSQKGSDEAVDDIDKVSSDGVEDMKHASTPEDEIVDERKKDSILSSSDESPGLKCFSKIDASLLKEEIPKGPNKNIGKENSGEICSENVEPDGSKINMKNGNHDHYKEGRLENFLDDNESEGCQPIILALEGNVKKSVKVQKRQVKKQLDKTYIGKHPKYSKSEEEMDGKNGDKITLLLDDDRVPFSSDTPVIEKEAEHNANSLKSRVVNNAKLEDSDEKDGKIQYDKKEKNGIRKRNMPAFNNSLLAKKKNSDSSASRSKTPASSLNDEQKRSVSCLKIKNSKTTLSTKGDDDKFESPKKTVKHYSRKIVPRRSYDGNDTVLNSLNGSGTVAKKMKLNSSHIPIAQTHQRRRTFLLNDEDEDEEMPRTPVHGKSKNILSAAISSKMSDAKDALKVKAISLDHRTHYTSIPAKGGLLKSFLKNGKQDRSPKLFLGSSNDAKLADHKTYKSQGKTEDAPTVKMSQVASPNFQSGTYAKYNASSDFLLSHKVNSSFSKEKLKITPKGDVNTAKALENRADINFSAERNLEKDPVERCKDLY